MKEQNAKKWFRSFLLLQVSVLLLLVGAVILIDPYFHYHKPIPGISYRLYEERYINDGISRNFEFDAMITGTSMTQNFKTSEFDALFGVQSVKEPFSGAGFMELSQNLDRTLTRNEACKTVLLCLDYNGLNREYDWTQYEDYPEYLYDNNPFNDVSYVLNKSILYRGCFSNLYQTLAGEESTSFDAYSAWTSPTGFAQVMQTYTRAEQKADSYGSLDEQGIARVKKNIDENIIAVVEKYPDTTFYLFYPPYSILYWDSVYMDGTLEWQLEAEALTTDMLLAHDNVRLFSFFENTQLICDLDNYRDKEHYIEDVNSYILEQIHQGNFEITEQNKEEHMMFMREFYTDFDYETFFAEQLQAN